jgi:hypothetical protein
VKKRGGLEGMNLVVPCRYAKQEGIPFLEELVKERVDRNGGCRGWGKWRRARRAGDGGEKR